MEQCEASQWDAIRNTTLAPLETYLVSYIITGGLSLQLINSVMQGAQGWIKLLVDLAEISFI